MKDTMKTANPQEELESAETGCLILAIIGIALAFMAGFGLGVLLA